MTLKGVMIAEGFPTLLTVVWLLSIFLCLILFVSSVRNSVTVERGVTHEEHSRYVTFTWFYSN
jgi:hypothetical protein